MDNAINYREILEAIESKEFDRALISINEAMQSHKGNGHLELLRMYCLNAMENLKEMEQTIEKIQGQELDHPLLHDIITPLDESQFDLLKQRLVTFVDEFKIFQEKVGKLPSGSQLNELLDFIIKKPFIK